MDWRFSLFLLTLLGLLAAFSLAPWESTLCGSGFVQDVLANHTKDGALSCFEFWFNRYQTLFGALVAVGAGWAAWRGVMKQVDRADDQIFLARQQNYNSFQDNISKQISELSELLKKIDLLSQLHHRAFDILIHLRNQASMISERNNEVYNDYKDRTDDYYDRLLVGYQEVLGKIGPLQESIEKSINISVFDEDINEKLAYYTKRASYMYNSHSDELRIHQRLIEMVFLPRTTSEISWAFIRVRMSESISLDGPYTDDFNVYPPIEMELQRLVRLRAQTRSRLESEFATYFQQ